VKYFSERKGVPLGRKPLIKYSAASDNKNFVLFAAKGRAVFHMKNEMVCAQSMLNGYYYFWGLQH
jgi:hypothetical protein